MKAITNKTIYKKVLKLQHDINQIKQLFLEDPPLLQRFIARMKEIESEKSVPIKEFGKKYGLK